MALTYLSSQTASSSPTSLSFISGIDSTYDAYEFHFINMHPSSDGTSFGFQVNTGSNQFITSTAFRALHNETGTVAALTYQTGDDQAQTQLYQKLWNGAGADADQAGSGILTLYAPSSTTYVKHFVSRSQFAHDADYSIQFFAAGYINTTSEVDEIDFKFSSGAIDAGTIHMYGVS